MARRLTLERRTYLCPIDGTRQPYNVYVPWKVRGQQGTRFPLVLLLHGFGGDETQVVHPRIVRLCEKFQTLLLAVRGRGDVFFDGPGEVDVLSALQHTLAEFPVDPDRVFAMGGSMGGTGTLRLATRYPDRFAGAVAICGWAHPPVWYEHWYGPAGAGRRVHPAHQPLLAQIDSTRLAGNLRHVPLILMHGARDKVVYPDNSRRMVAAARRAGIDVAYREFARSGHAGFRSRWDAIFRWMNGAGFGSWTTTRREAGIAPLINGPRRRPRAPARVTYTSDGIHHTRAYWLEVLRDPWNPYALVGAEATVASGDITVTLHGASGVRLDLQQAPLKRDRPVGLRLGREKLADVPPRDKVVIRADGSLEMGKDARPGAIKHAPRGALIEALRAPFLIVAPSEGPDVAEAERFAQHWTAWMIPHDEDGRAIGMGMGRPRVKRDVNVTAADRARYNLILFGRPAENRELKRIAGRLPFAIRGDGITIAGKSHRGSHLGLRVITRNPANPLRTIVCCVGATPARIKDLEAIGWYWPEYVVFDPRRALRHTNHDDWQQWDRAVARGEINLETIDPDRQPLRYLPDGWIAAGFDDELWRVR